MKDMKESLDAFRSYLWKNSQIVSAKTVEQYVSVFGQILRFSGGKTKQITKIKIREYLKKKKSRIAVRQLRTVLNYASKLFPEVETLSDTEWKNIHGRKKKVMTYRLPFSSKAMLTRIYSVDHEIAQVMMLISLHTGCRMGALAEMKVEDYNPDTQTIRLLEKGNKEIHYEIHEFTLVERLEKIIEHSSSQKPLLAMRTIQKYCESIDLQAHDFRRLYSKKIMEAYKNEGYSDKEALEATRISLNHEHIDTTYGYASYGSIELTKRGDDNGEKK